MHNPVRSETDAFRIVVLVTGVAGLALAAGYAIGTGAGIVVLGLALVLALSWLVATHEPLQPLIASVTERGDQHRVLVVANAVAPDSVWEQLGDHGGASASVEVLAPVLQSRTHFVTTDVGDETRDARRRLGATVAGARRRGIQASGSVGDPLNPIDSLDDELRLYCPDEVILVTHRGHDRNWLEDEMLAEVRRADAVDLTEVPV